MRKADDSLRGTFRKFLTFSWIGILSTGSQYIALGLLVELLSMDPVVASCIAYAVLAIGNYYLNYRFTFASDAAHTAALPKFFIISGCGLWLNGLLMLWMVDHLDSNYWLAQIVATGTVLVWNFCGNLLWSFRIVRG